MDMARSWNPLEWIRSGYQKFDEWSAGLHRGWAEGNRQAGAQRNTDLALRATEDPRAASQLRNLLDETAKYGGGSALSDEQFQEQLLRLQGATAASAAKGSLGANKPEAMEARRQAYAQEMGQRTLRGQPRRIIPGLAGDKGNMELVNSLIANNAAVRRTGQGLAVLGTGAGLTAGAQQLMALMEYMGQGQQTAQRAEQSPLTDSARVG